MKKKITFLPCILLLLLLSFCNDYLIFPFKIKNPILELNNNKIQASVYLKYIKYNQLATKLYVGTPIKETEIYLTMQQYDFILGKNFCLNNSNSQYNPFSSNSYSKTQMTVTSPLFTNGSSSTESFIFYNNLNLTNNKTINEVQFIYGVASSDFFDLIEPDSYCGYLGLQLCDSEYFEWDSLIYELKMKREIQSKKWAIIFYGNNKKINNNDGYFILGIKEEDYQDLFNININNDNEYTTIYSLPYIYNKKNWEIKFDEIYYYINSQNYSFFTYIQGNFLIDSNYIICNNDYFNSIKNNFFNKYINEGICFLDKNETIKRTKKTDIQMINVIICDKNKFKDINKFPTLYFKHRDLNKIFEFTYKELFQQMGNYMIFSIVLDEEEESHWVFGRLFLKKIPICF